VIAHALGWLAAQDLPADIACGIYATAPFVTASDLQSGYDLLISAGKRFAFSVTKFEFSIQRAIRRTFDGGVAPLFPEWIDYRSQDLEEAYHDAGQFYWGHAEAFCRDLPLFAVHSAPVILPRYRVMDIDSLEDWTQAELMYVALANRKTQT
jgi:N-acylneuraminate cytidylyltransferase